MPTQIIDGFKLSSSTPIDSRMVASGSIARNSIQYKYEGLKVYDTSDKTTYVWSGTDWTQDGGSGGSGGVYIGAVNRVAKYFAGGFTNSVIYDSSTSNTIRVGIGKSATTYALEVNGTIEGTTLIGSYDGKGLIDSSVTLNKIGKPMMAGTYVLKSIGNTNQWVLESTSALSVGVANNTTMPTGYLTFTSGSATGASLSINNVSSNKAIALNASTSQFLASSDTTNSSSKPGYSFLGAASTGLYASTTEVGISLGGSKTIYSTSTSTKIAIAALEVAKFEGNAIFLYKSTTITSLIVSGSTNLSSLAVTGNTTLFTTTISGITTINNNFTINSNLQNSPPVKILNTSGTGLYIKSAGELRLDTNTSDQINVITFFKGGAGASLGSLSPTNRRGWLGYGSVSNDNFYIYNDVGPLYVGNGSGAVYIDGNVNIGKTNGPKGLTVWGETIRTAAYIQIKAQPGQTYPTENHTSINPAGTFFGRYPKAQEVGTDGVAFIRVDKHATEANWGGLYTFSTNGTFTSNKLRLNDLPTSATGLEQGTVWRDNNILKIKL
jgi:hypothetical protein